MGFQLMYNHIRIINDIFSPPMPLPHGSICLSKGIKTQQKEKAPCFYCVLPTAVLPFSFLRKKKQTALQLAAKP